MDIIVTVQVVGDGYKNLAGREIVIRDLACPEDMRSVSYLVGQTVGGLIDTLAKQLDKPAVFVPAGTDDEVECE